MNKDTSGPAFPLQYEGSTRSDASGMTLRDYFAAKAMQGFSAASDMNGVPLNEVARQAYDVADAMLEARSK